MEQLKENSVEEGEKGFTVWWANITAARDEKKQLNDEKKQLNEQKTLLIKERQAPQGVC